ncbi:5-formyltetrahydrofolate cyclo-ligase [Aquirufa sp. OSTEICH-129V]|jgi:5-formyltetrahydrofolate cyclo-ligase|uniref:5-formyltetrahydrofolate cyclo-ligase n=1 Tax=Aquirufa avitistagni TaxID=3104728 RepID=A0ABW6D836_9BACT
MNKSRLRQLALTRRKNVSEHVFGLLNESLQQEFMDFITSFQLPHRIMSFQPIVERREVHMSFIHETLESLGHQLCFPRVENESEMVAYHVPSNDALITSDWGIQEPNPQTCQKVPITDIDLVIIPLLAFDANGNRVGYGKGFYDRFLQDCRPDTLKIGVCLDEPVQRIDDVEAHDIPLDLCISPIGLHLFEGFYPKNPFDSMR